MPLAHPGCVCDDAHMDDSGSQWDLVRSVAHIQRRAGSRIPAAEREDLLGPTIERIRERRTASRKDHGREGRSL